MNEFSIGNNFDTVWERISKETGIKSLRQLAVIIDKKQPTISAAKAKGDFPPGWAYQIANHFGLLTEWLMTGRGPKALSKISNNRKFEILDQIEEWLNEEVKKDPKNEVWFEMDFEKKYEGFKKWKDEKEDQESKEANTLSSKVA